METAASSLALCSNWLSDSNNTIGTIQTSVYPVNYWPDQVYWPQWTYPVYVSGPSRPIKLTLSEVERLRKAAKTDKALSAILVKFTEQIEVVVDFT